MEKAYKFRIYPTDAQAGLMRKTFGCCRYVYNHYLAERQSAYKSTGKTLGYAACNKDMTALKKRHPWMREADSTALQSSLRHLDDAYGNFFRRAKSGEKPGYPKYKRKFDLRQSYTSVAVGKNIELSAKAVKLPKLGWVKCKVSKRAEGRILSATVSRSPSGKHYVSVLCTGVVAEQLPKTGKTVGVDLGITAYAAVSDGRKFENYRHFRKSEKRLARRQRALSRKSIGSKNYAKAKRKVALLHEKIANQRNDALHKLSAQIVREYDVIAVETLDIKGMMQTRWLAKSIGDAAWGEFVRQLGYKSQWYGKQFVRVDKAYPSSQLCSSCGHLEPKLKDLSIREWVCPACGKRHDRDINAAVNILGEGLRILAA
jgi:putative transposase